MPGVRAKDRGLDRAPDVPEQADIASHVKKAHGKAVGGNGRRKCKNGGALGDNERGCQQLRWKKFQTHKVNRTNADCGQGDCE